MAKTTNALLCLLLCILCLGGGFFLGRATVPDTPDVQQGPIQTFYAVITDLDETSMSAAGLDVNSINFRGDYSFRIEDDTALTWNYTSITMDDFQIGDRIAITFTGDVSETDPAGLQKVLQIDLLARAQDPSSDTPNEDSVELP